jgi:spore coat protein U-like protein
MKPPRRDRSAILAAATLLGTLTALPAAASVSCSLAVTPLAFGPYVPFSSTPTDSTATITVTCSTTGASPVALTASISLTGGGTAPYGRQLADGPYLMRYHTYLNSARTVYWGDGSGLGATEPVSGVVGPSAPFQQTFTVYGRILARQTGANVGAYTDQITAVLTY